MPRGSSPGPGDPREPRPQPPHRGRPRGASRLEGFLAFAPDALTPRGGYPGNEDDARASFKELDRARSQADFKAGLAWLKAHDACTGKVGAVGFCWEAAWSTGSPPTAPT